MADLHETERDGLPHLYRLVAPSLSTDRPVENPSRS